MKSKIIALFLLSLVTGLAACQPQAEETAPDATVSPVEPTETVTPEATPDAAVTPEATPDAAVTPEATP